MTLSSTSHQHLRWTCVEYLNQTSVHDILFIEILFVTNRLFTLIIYYGKRDIWIVRTRKCKHTVATLLFSRVTEITWLRSHQGENLTALVPKRALHYACGKWGHCATRFSRTTPTRPTRASVVIHGLFAMWPNKLYNFSWWTDNW